MFRGALGLVVVCLLVWAPVAFAVPPVNDDFDDAQALVGGLPIELSTTNVEATKEEGEPLHGILGSKGHSVWFQWEATSTGFVTVGTCGSDFSTVASVYTGTKVDELHEVAGDFASAGPGCPSFNGREITFEAIGGTSYEIAVDGDPFYLPPAEPPVGEGAIELQLKATPVPANDDFVDATALSASIEEEEGAEFAFYYANASGFNWNATKESGEPDHDGDPGGASVWYAWTAPESGTAHAGACANVGLLFGVYTGDSVDALTPIGSDRSPCPNVSFSASAGTTYRLAVDGQFDSEAGSPELGSLSAHVSMQLPPRAKGVQAFPQRPAEPAKDTTPPNTKIHRRALKRRPPIWIFGFESNEPGSTFRCKLDKRPFAICGSGKRYDHLPLGRHTLRTFAVDPVGNADPSPAVVHFAVPGSGTARAPR